ncbi:C40 family peptidase, partial [Pedobacter sp.]|uniref:C40 family peptidase n=1 Tax=Pedobacter sp. TaxID=1411316 RepID=UPI003D7FC0AC
MKKTLTFFSLVFLFALQGKSQTNVQNKFQDKLQKLALELPAQQPAATALISFAKTLIGIPYHYASSNPQKGFDCSGFVNYVFNNFGVKVPRSSS